MNKSILYDNVKFLFNRKWDDITDEEDDILQEIYKILIRESGWEAVFAEIDKYRRTECLDGESACNFANLYWSYGCYEQIVAFPYSFLGYLYYRMNLDPWKYDADVIMDSLFYKLLCTENDDSHNPFWGTGYTPETDPDIIAEVEKLRKTENKE